MVRKKKKIQDPMMKRINKPFEEVLERLVKTDLSEVKKLIEKDKPAKDKE
jgi:hypothetical protein